MGKVETDFGLSPWIWYQIVDGMKILFKATAIIIQAIAVTKGQNNNNNKTAGVGDSHDFSKSYLPGGKMWKSSDIAW